MLESLPMVNEVAEKCRMEVETVAAATENGDDVVVTLRKTAVLDGERILRSIEYGMFTI